MITTDTGAKKIENTDNWRLIFDAHNDSVDAEDKIVPEMAPIVNGNKSTVGAAIGEYVLVRNSSITGITDGAYTAAKAIPANTTIDSTYLTAVGTGGALNALNSKINGLPEVLSSGTVSSTTYDFAYKFPNGALICVHSISVTPSSWTAWGNCYESNQLLLGNWLVEFTSQPMTMISQGSTSSGGWIESHDQISKTSCGRTYIVRPNAGTGLTFRINVVGYGYWK